MWTRWLARCTSGLTQKVSIAPQASQVIAQPSGTQMQTNLLNGVEYASLYTSGLAATGLRVRRVAGLREWMRGEGGAEL